MLDWIIAAGSLVFFGLAVLLWVQCSEIEWEPFANGTSHHLE